MAPETTAPAGAANPQDTRTCAKCNETKVVSPATWPHRKGRQGHYQPYGGACINCEKKRKAAYEARRDKIAALVADVPAEPTRGTSEDKNKQRVAVNHSKMDVAKALKAGAKTLNEYAPSALARLIEYCEDVDSPHHQWALEHVLQRIQPRKLYESIGGEAAGVGAIHDKRPMFVLNVQPAVIDGRQGNTYDHDGQMKILPVTPEGEESDAG